YGHEFDEINTREIPEALYKSLNKQFEIGDCVKVDAHVQEFFTVKDAETETKVDMAISRLREAGYNMSPTLIIKIGIFSNEKTKTIQCNNKTAFIPVGVSLSETDLVAELVKANEMHIHGLKRDGVEMHFVGLFTK